MGSNRHSGRVHSDTWPDEAIGGFAGRQKSLIKHGQLVGLGVHPRTISRAVARKRLSRVHSRVYSLVPPRARPLHVAEFAALLAHGPSAVLSHHAAARLHNSDVSFEDAVHVTLVGMRRKPFHSGIVLHSTPELHRQEQHRLHGLPVTSVARTVLDLAAHLDGRALERLIDEALTLNKTSRTKLTEALGRHPGRPGTPAIRALLDPDRPSSLTASHPEEELLTLIRAGGLPPPETNVSLTRDYTPDLLWREQRVIVEYDSEEWHMGRRAFHGDRTRHNDLSATAGYLVLHVTKKHALERVLVWIARALGPEQ